MRKDKRYIVYVHENKINHMVYVGITSHSDPNMRWRNGNGYKGTYFYNAIQKYGWDGFTHKVVMEGLTQEEAFQAEKRLIKELRASDRRYGYNIADGGQFPGQAAFDALEKCHKDSMVKVVRLNDGMVYNSIVSAEMDNNTPNPNIIKVCKGLRHTAGVMSNGEPIFWAYYIDGMDVKAEFRDRVEAKKNAYRSMSNKVVCVTTDEIFLSLTDAQSRYCDCGTHLENIIKCCNGKNNFSGRLQDGTPLRWVYYWDYIKLTPDDIASMRSRPTPRASGVAVQCVEDGKTFYTLQQAANYYGINNAVSIRQQLNGRVKNIYVDNRTRKIHFVEVSGSEQYDG